MNLTEYERVKNMTYLEYCDYLQNKYGKSNYDYMTKSWNKNAKVSRTSEGLFAHHKYEDHAILLGEKEHAMNNPFEWQKAENIIYCDYLEHLLLHAMICEYPSPDRNPMEAVGIGGAINFLIPELNDLYSGMPIALKWKSNCFEKVKDSVDCYITIVNRLIKNSHNYPCFNMNQIKSSYNESFGAWHSRFNSKLVEKFIVA